MWKQRQSEYVTLLQGTKKSSAEDRLKYCFLVWYLDTFPLITYCPVAHCANKIQHFLQHLSFEPLFLEGPNNNSNSAQTLLGFMKS